MSDNNGGVLVLYNLPRPPGSGGPACAESDAGVLAEVEAVCAALAALGVPARRCGVRRLDDLPLELSTAPERAVFNLVESLEGDLQDFNLVPAICRAFGKAYTGSDTPCLLKCLDKWQTKAALRAAGVPTPDGVVVASPEARPVEFPHGPLIVKPLMTDASEGIGPDSVFPAAGPGLWEAIARIHRDFGCPALVEQYIEGREVNVSVVQMGAEPTVLPLAEIEFNGFRPDQPRIVDYRAKWVSSAFEFHNTVRRVPAPLPEAVADQVRCLALAAWRAVGCQDYARVDFRLDANLRPYVLEVNTNPDVSPDAGFAAALAAGGIRYADFVGAMVRNALARLSHAARPPQEAGELRQGEAPIHIRWSRPEDRGAILAMVAQTGAFRPNEIAVAREVLDAALAAGPDGHYQSYIAVVDERPVGWVCFGPTPCSVHTFDIYWVVVAPQHQGKGVGTALIAHAEKLAAARGGRLAVIETSGRASYHSARQFYQRLGYQESSRLPNFYAPDDDKVIYTKRLA